MNFGQFVYLCGKNMDTSLLQYIEQEIIPRYSSFDKAHREDHVRTVIARALEMGRGYDIDEDMLLAAAAFHDLGLAVDRKTHHLESGRIIREDGRLREWFSEEQIETIAQAAEDHRASAKTAPRSIYGRLVAEADRLIVPETIIRRTIQYGMSHYPGLDREGHWQRTLEHLNEKYARGGYLHLLIPGSPNEEPLERLRTIIEDRTRLREIFDRMFEEERGEAPAVIRLAGPGDLEAVGRLLEQVLKVHHEGRPDLFRAEGRKYSDEELLGIFADPETPVFVYDRGGSVLGYAFCALQHVSSGSQNPVTTLYVDDICVDEAARREHIGKALFGKVKEYAVSQGCHNITLHVWECNPEALAFYKAMGMSVQFTSMEILCQ